MCQHNHSVLRILLLWSLALLQAALSSDHAPSDLYLPCSAAAVTTKQECDFSAIARAAGKTVATPGSVPYLVSLQDNQYDDPYHFCSGIIVAEKWVLSTAFCVMGYKPSDIKVVAGEYDITLLEGSEQVTEADEIILHESFSIISGRRSNDIALVRVNPQFNFTSRVRKEELSRKSPSHVGETCYTSGWGMSNGIYLPFPVLTTADVTVISMAECKKAYPWFKYMRQSICGKAEALQGPCMGDWGSPLICDQNVIGLASWSNGCGDENFPAVFVDISKYILWIQETMKLRD